MRRINGLKTMVGETDDGHLTFFGDQLKLIDVRVIRETDYQHLLKLARKVGRKRGTEGKSEKHT